MKKNLKKIISLTVILTLVFLLCPIHPTVVHAAADLTHMSDTLTTLAAGADANQQIMFRTPTGLAASETIVLTYDSDFLVHASLDYEDIDLSWEAVADGVCGVGDTEMALLADPVTTTMGVQRTSGTVITFINGSVAVAAGGEICIQIGTNADHEVQGVQQIKNATTANSYNLAITGTIGDPDSGTIVIDLITDDSVDVTATVNATLDFTIDGDLDIVFGTLTTSNARFAGDSAGTDGPTSASAHTMKVTTNSTSGYTITYNGATLTDAIPEPDVTITAATITGDEDGAPNSEQFAIGFTTNGNATIVTAYNQVTPTFNYKFETGTTQIISETVATAEETFSAFYLANIGGTTEAGTYTTSITYICTGNF